MARQRFIWPDIWKDPVFGRLSAAEQVLFIGLFSIADDEGRLNADPAYLRSELFAYTNLTPKKVQAIRDSVVAKCVHIHLYRANDNDYIALLKWHEYQKPKYPKPSKLPAPFLEASPKPSGKLPENGSLGWVGLGREGLLAAEKPSAAVAVDEPAKNEPADLKPQPRARDELWEALLDVCGIDQGSLTKTGRGAANKALSEIREAGGTVADIRGRSAEFKRRYPQIALTASALAKHWGSLRGAEVAKQDKYAKLFGRDAA